MEGRYVVDECGEKPMADIPIGVAVIGFPEVRIHVRASAVGIGGDVECVRPGVARQELQSAGITLPENDAHALVIGYYIVVEGPDSAKQLIGPSRVYGPRSGKQRRVVVKVAIQVVGMRAQILQLQTAA